MEYQLTNEQKEAQKFLKICDDRRLMLDFIKKEYRRGKVNKKEAEKILMQVENKC